MQRVSHKDFSVVILFITGLLLFSCHDRTFNTTKDLDSTKAISSSDLKYNDDTTLINQGKSLFVTNCGACHAIFKTDNYLAGIADRVGVNYFKLYITKQDSLIKAKDKYALELKKDFGNLANVHNFHFSGEQLNAIAAYLKKYSP